jgi:hypothetical protein
MTSRVVISVIALVILVATVGSTEEPAKQAVKGERSGQTTREDAKENTRVDR